MYSNQLGNGYVPSAQFYPYAYGNNNRRNIQPVNAANSDRLGGFLFPFLLGGVTGGLVAPYFYPRPYYNNYYYSPYPYYGPYYRNY